MTQTLTLKISHFVHFIHTWTLRGGADIGLHSYRVAVCVARGGLPDRIW